MTELQHRGWLRIARKFFAFAFIALVLLLEISQASAQEDTSHRWYIVTLSNGDRIQLEFQTSGRDVQSECIHENGALSCMYYGTIDSVGNLRATERCRGLEERAWRPDGLIRGRVVDDGKRIVGEWSDTANLQAVAFEAVQVASFIHWTDTSSPYARLKGTRLELALPSIEFTNGINDHLTRYIDEHIARVVRSTDARRRNWIENSIGPIEPVHYTTWFDIQWCSPDLVSVLATHQTMIDTSGWRYEVEGLTFHFSDNHLRTVALPDLFLTGSDYESRIRPYLYDDARERLVMEMRGWRLVELSESTMAAMYRAADSALIDIDYSHGFRNFAISLNGLRFASLPVSKPGYDDYVFVPYSELVDIIDPKGPLARFLTDNHTPHR
jgi:hypothetical protein